MFPLLSKFSSCIHEVSKKGGGANQRTLIGYFDEILIKPKGQLISKTNCQAEDSPIKRTNEFVFTSMRRVFVRFLGESLA